MVDITNTLIYLGITHDRILPFLILVGIMGLITYKGIYPVKKSISGLTRALLEIQTIFKMHGVSITHNLLEGPGSPIQPTQYGSNLIIQSGLGKILDEQKKYLGEALKRKLPEKYTEYDVQEKARELLVDLKTNEIMNPVKVYAYENGIDADAILKIGGLWLRDDFLGQQRRTLPEQKNE